MQSLEAWVRPLDGSGKGAVNNCPTTVTDAASQVSGEVKNQLDCTFVDSSVPAGSSNGGLWNSVYSAYGSCTGFGPDAYFKALGNGYNKFNANQVMKNNGVKPPSVDRTTFLNQLSAAFGKRAWIECDDSKNLKAVVVCLDPNNPSINVDCPWYPEQTGGNGMKCAGTLYLPTTSTSPAAIKTPTNCVAYVKPYYDTGSPSPVPDPYIPIPNPLNPSPNPIPSPSSSSNTGAIVGGVIGGLAAAGLIVGGILFYKKKKKNDTTRAGAAATMENGYSNGTSGPSPYTYNATQGDPRFASVPPTASAYPLPQGMAAAGAGVGLATAAGYGSTMSGRSGSQPSTPASPSSLSTSLSRRTSNALATDPLFQYINSTMSTLSGTSRGPLAAWQLRFEDIRIDRPIGEGSWGRVYKGNWQGTDVAVKVLLNSETGAEASATASALMATNSPVMARLEQEAGLMTQLHHPNIVQFLGITVFPAALVTEFCAKGSLTSVLQGGLASQEKAAELTWSRRISMAADCVRGMIYLHTREPAVIHRDLKSANLLVTESWKVKVSDFNLSKIMQDSTRSTSMQAMNPRWLANEVLNGSAATLSSDVFAFGVILWELLTWQLPWGTANPWGIVSAIGRGERLEIPRNNELPGPNSGAWRQLPRYIELMNRCWHQDPAQRPSFQEVIAELQAIDPAANSN